jgi:hypothetical protein
LIFDPIAPRHREPYSSSVKKGFIVRASKGNPKTDFTQTASAIVSQSIGEGLFDGKPLPDPNEGEDPAAVERGRQGGLKGGTARAEKLTPKQRKTIALKAAKARWKG